MMLVWGISIVHLPDQFIEARFIVLIEPESNADLFRLIFGTEGLSVGQSAAARRLRERRSGDQQNSKASEHHSGKIPACLLEHRVTSPGRIVNLPAGAGCTSVSAGLEMREMTGVFLPRIA